MGWHESQDVREMDSEIIEMINKYMKITFFLYGPYDHYAPESYFHDLKAQFPEGFFFFFLLKLLLLFFFFFILIYKIQTNKTKTVQAELASPEIAHAFVLKFSKPVAEKVASKLFTKK